MVVRGEDSSRGGTMDVSADLLEDDGSEFSPKKRTASQAFSVHIGGIWRMRKLVRWR